MTQYIQVEDSKQVEDEQQSQQMEVEDKHQSPQQMDVEDIKQQSLQLMDVEQPQQREVFDNDYHASAHGCYLVAMGAVYFFSNVVPLMSKEMLWIWTISVCFHVMATWGYISHWLDIFNYKENHLRTPWMFFDTINQVVLAAPLMCYYYSKFQVINAFLFISFILLLVAFLLTLLYLRSLWKQNSTALLYPYLILDVVVATLIPIIEALLPIKTFLPISWVGFIVWSACVGCTLTYITKQYVKAQRRGTMNQVEEGIILQFERISNKVGQLSRLLLWQQPPPEISITL